MAVNIKNNFAPIIENKEGGVVNVQVADAVERYKEYIDVIETEKSTSEKPRRRKTEAKLVDYTFTYRWAQNRESQIRVVRLYQALLKFKWIADDTAPEDFGVLFSGKEKGTKIKWVGKKAFLAYLFKVIFKNGYIILPEGYEKKIWLIVQSHFVDNNSRIFVNLNKEHKPKLKAATIEKLASILDPATELVEVDIEPEDETEGEVCAGIKDKGWDM